MNLRTCVSESGNFRYGIHKPDYKVVNLRAKKHEKVLGHFGDIEITNHDDKYFNNFPEDEVSKSKGWVFEVPNAFPFMGSTFILKSNADDPKFKQKPISQDAAQIDIKSLSDPITLAFGQASRDPAALAELANLSCVFENDAAGSPVGIAYIEKKGEPVRDIIQKDLFEVLANNSFLPDEFKRIMVLDPGAQGPSEIMGDYTEGETNIFEYLRGNSYIPWGHYAANMAHNSIRYKAGDLTLSDIKGLRHLYYQRIYVQLAQKLEIPDVPAKRQLTTKELEFLRTEILKRDLSTLNFNASIWGQNFGYDYSLSGHKLHASHQQVHQQYALIPSSVTVFQDGKNEEPLDKLPTHVQGDDVAKFCLEYRQETGHNFFDDYVSALRANKRLDGVAERSNNLFIYDRNGVTLFVPKAQRSPWELQILVNNAGNILEADAETRELLDKAILSALKILEKVGASMITAYEISGRFGAKGTGQKMLYSFLPVVPSSPAGWCEKQDRWIVGHYPEDFAKKCRENFIDLANRITYAGEKSGSNHSTVTLFARFLGWSTWQPLFIAM